MPEIRSPKKPKEEKTAKPKVKSSAVVSAYSEEGAKRNERTRKINFVAMIVSAVVAVALIGALIFVFVYGGANGWFA